MNKLFHVDQNGNITATKARTDSDEGYFYKFSDASNYAAKMVIGKINDHYEAINRLQQRLCVISKS